MSLVLKSTARSICCSTFCRREDGFHELETIMQPVPLCDELQLERTERGLELSCNDSRLQWMPQSGHRAATAFLSKAEVEGVRIHLQKISPRRRYWSGQQQCGIHLARLNELFESPLNAETLQELAAGLGPMCRSFYRMAPFWPRTGEVVQPVDFPALAGKGLLLIHPGFGVSTPWAYRHWPIAEWIWRSRPNDQFATSFKCR